MRINTRDDLRRLVADQADAMTLAEFADRDDAINCVTRDILLRPDCPAFGTDGWREYLDALDIVAMLATHQTIDPGAPTIADVMRQRGLELDGDLSPDDHDRLDNVCLAIEETGDSVRLYDQSGFFLRAVQAVPAETAA